MYQKIPSRGSGTLVLLLPGSGTFVLLLPGSDTLVLLPAKYLHLLIMYQLIQIY